MNDFQQEWLVPILNLPPPNAITEWKQFLKAKMITYNCLFKGI